MRELIADKIRRIERLMAEQDGRQDKDAAWVYDPMQIDARIRRGVYAQVLLILKDGGGTDGGLPAGN